MKNLIRTILTLMVCLVVCSFLSPTALAETIASGASGDNLNWTLDNEGSLFISGYGDMTSSDGWSEHINEQGVAEAAQETAKQAKDDAEAAAESVSQGAAQIETNKQDIDDLKSAVTDAEGDIDALQTAVPGKVNKPVSSPNGTNGQLLRTNGDGTTTWVDQGLPTDAQTATAVTAWLNAHPEATTTVQDGSITLAKLSQDTVNEFEKTPYNTVYYTDNGGDFASNINTLLSDDNVNTVIVQPGSYNVSNTINVPAGKTLKLAGNYHCDEDESAYTILVPTSDMVVVKLLGFKSGVDGGFIKLGATQSVGVQVAAFTASQHQPDTAWLEEFAAQPGYHILLSHQPEYFPLVPDAVDLILSGQAHGGQVRLFNPFKWEWTGLWSPGQSLWPKWTRGVYERNRLVVSAGLSNTTWIPRLFNPTEVVYLESP